MNFNLPKIEKRILSFWKREGVSKKCLEKRGHGKKFIFFQGPPYLNGLPHMGHFFTSVIKDVILRYKTMQRYFVSRMAGWDTHGLPTENEVEKRLKIDLKKDIERIGMKKFINECKKSIYFYKSIFEKSFERFGFWLDYKNAYITCSNDYIESIWLILKEIWKKNLLYQDFKVSPYCPRCQTVLSSHEVAQGYKKIKEPAIYVKFPILNPEFKNTSLLVWTTTPWTLPGNVAVAVNPDFIYTKVKTNDEYLILAKERIEFCGTKGEIEKEFKGKDLVGLRYQTPYPFSEEIIKQVYLVIPADFVSLEQGTGLVHIAPAFGEEDMTAWREQFPIFNLQFPQPIDEEGKFTLKTKKFAGLFVKDADPLIIKDLKERGFLFKEELYEHDYPFCWRCDSPLLYYAKKSWFIRMTKVKNDLIRNNQKINWIPKHLKKGRFGEWLREVKDWALSRERYWGTPLPIWQCQAGKFQISNSRSQIQNSKQCDNVVVIGSLKDLLSQKFSTNQYFILRHGQTIYQTEKKNEIYPYPEKEPIGLTKEGIQQIQKVAQKLKKEKIDLIYSSDLPRAKQTAEIIAKELNLKVNFDKRLRDVNFGIYHGCIKEKYFKEFPLCEKRFEKKPKKGESWLQCQKRMIKFLSEIDKKYQNKKILIVSHGDPLWLLEGAMKGKTKKELIEEKKRNKIIDIGELRKLEFKILPFNEKMELDFHRPYIDEVKFYCPKCQNLMTRVPEVIDCWFDSGAMPFAQVHWPFIYIPRSKIKNQKLKPPKLFPADYISEGIDQTRGWFYTLLAVSTLLGFGSPYKNVISVGHVLDEKGEKMSKSKGNVVDPWYIIEKYGADTLRWYFYTINQPWDSKLFSEKDVVESLRKFILTFWNCWKFFETYIPKKSFFTKFLISNNILDKWIISKLNQLILDVTNSLDKYDITTAARSIENFVVNDLSLWYIRRSRKRFKEVAPTLNFVLLTLSKLTAPFIPFLSEEIYQKLTTYNLRLTTSVHLADWPRVDKKLIDRKLERKMEKVREIVSLALAERAKAKIKVRQPLYELQISSNYELEKELELLDLIKEEVNVKNISFGKEFKLDTKITPELKEEGIVREVIRYIQEMRKKLGLKPKDKISIGYFGTPNLNEILTRNKNFILKETKAKDFILTEKSQEKFDLKEKKKVNQENLLLGLKRL